MSTASAVSLLQNAALVTGAGTVAQSAGAVGSLAYAEVIEGNTGTATVQFQGSFDGTNWYAMVYAQTDATDTLTYGHADLSVTQNMKHVYVIRDSYPQMRANISVISAGTVTVKLLRAR